MKLRNVSFEHQDTMIFIACVVFLTVCFATRYLLFRKPSKSRFNNLDEIPCPGSIPIFGNICDMFYSDAKIWKITRNRALKYYPIYRLKFFNSNSVCLLHPEDIEQILGSSKHIHKSNMYNTFRRFSGNGLLVNNGESWRKRRKLLTKNFHFAALHDYMEIFNKEVQTLGHKLQNGVNTSLDILEPISHTTLKIINEILVGKDLKLPESEIKDYVSAIDTLSRSIGYINSKPILSLVYKYSEMKKEEDRSLEVINTFAKDVLKNWKVKPDDNPRVLDVMLDAPSLYDDQSVMDEIITFIFAGNSTSSAGLIFALFVLANHPEYQDEVYEEIVQIVCDKEEPSHVDLKSMSFLDRFLKESMRLYPPAPFIGRTLAEDVVTKTGYRIPSGTSVVFNIFDIHRSPFIYDNPEKFDPDRFLPENSKKRHPFSYLPFSAGPRNCIAQKFAFLEIKACICKILTKFKVEPVTLTEDIQFIPDVTLTTKEKIQMKFVNRS